ncbi:MAG: sarcosine oxidase subunit delta [Pseudomonadota bacterium]
MFMITCPYCGERDQSEFSNGGEAHIVRPEWRDDMTDAEWADFVFLRHNKKGIIAERWCHTAGCGKWFNVLRNSTTDRMLAVYEMGAEPPKVEDENLPTPSGETIGSGNDAVKVLVDAGEAK